MQVILCALLYLIFLIKSFQNQISTISLIDKMVSLKPPLHFFQKIALIFKG